MTHPKPSPTTLPPLKKLPNQNLAHLKIFFTPPNSSPLNKKYFYTHRKKYSPETESDMVKHELRVTSYELELRVESLKERVEIRKYELNFKSTSWNSNPRVTSSNSQVQESLNH